MLGFGLAWAFTDLCHAVISAVSSHVYLLCWVWKHHCSLLLSACPLIQRSLSLGGKDIYSIYGRTFLCFLISTPSPVVVICVNHNLLQIKSPLMRTELGINLQI